MYKKFILSLGIAAMASAGVFAQITTRHVADKPVPGAPGQYDSLSVRLTPDNYKQFIGQKIYVQDPSKLYFKERKPEYTGFLKHVPGNDNLKKKLAGFTSVPSAVTSINLNEVGYKTVAGKYFTIDDIIDYTDKRDESAGLYFKLTEVDTKKELVYFQSAIKAQFDNFGLGLPFIMVGNFEKLKSAYKGKRFMSKSYLNQKDVNTARPVSFERNTVLTCSDVTVIETENNPYMKPAVFFKDSTGNEIAVLFDDMQFAGIASPRFESMDSINHRLAREKLAREQAERERQARIEAAKKEEEHQKELRAQQEAEEQRKVEIKARTEQLIKKYGPKYGNMVAKKELMPGMSTDMCEDAMGKPGDVMKTGAQGSRETWTYDNGMILIFDNKKLTNVSRYTVR